MTKDELNIRNYTHLDLPFFVGQRRLLYSTSNSPDTLSVELLGHKSKGMVLGTVIFGTKSEGPPKHTHGGMISYVLDETMGAAAWHAKKQVVAETIEIKFRKLTPLFTKLRIFGKVQKTVGDNVYVMAKIFDQDKKLFCTSRGRFRILSKDKLNALKLLVS
ncbi:MAG: PaaI family thioesterase [Bdellovibrionales bacterium]|nr:PaaI family thioesterase [Bdellovibrionales bacterium]